MRLDDLDREPQIETRESLERDLACVEAELAREYQISGEAVRRELVNRVRSGAIPETAKVTEWLALYTAVMEWLEQPDSPTRAPEATKEAAHSGLFYMALAC